MDGLLEALGPIGPFLPLIGAVLVAVGLERMRPWRRGLRLDGLRWLHVGVLYLASVILVRLLIPVSVAQASIDAAGAGIGVFNLVSVPLWISVPATVLALDFADYARHWLQHRFGLLWRAHRVHHSDEHLDAATALRFHPFEVALTVIGYLVVVGVFGAPVLGVAIHASLVILFDVWEHANIATPAWSRRLTRVIVTPDVHRLHHSENPAHHDTNYGIIFTLWDRLFGTYMPPDPSRGTIRFGLGPENRLTFDSLEGLLSDPFRRG